MYFVYILKSKKDGTYYVGYSADVNRRLKEHNNGKVRYTRGRAPYMLIHTERFQSIEDAKKKESSIKKGKNIKRYLKMIGSPAP